MADRPQISIIVPVFRSEQHLHISLNSILAQTFTDWEAILVNDCSPDDSGKICERYANSDKRFKVIHNQKNEGVFLTRKNGLKVANGFYITHLDCDDYYDSKFLEKMYNKAMEIDNGYDMVFCGYRVIDDKGNLIKKTKFKKEFIWEKDKEKRIRDYFTRKYMQFALWNTLIKKEFYDKVVHPNIFLTLREDTFVYIQLCYFLEKVALLRENLYSWIRYTTSASNLVSKSADEVLRIVNMETDFYKHLYRILENFNDKEYLAAFIKYYSPYFVASKARYFSLPKREKTKLRESHFLEHLIELHRYGKLKHRILFFFRGIGKVTLL